MPIATLTEMSHGAEADLFLLMSAKEELKTKTGKPYFRVGFRDGGREVSFPVWGDSPWAMDCRDHWTPGIFYKVRAVYQETSYGPQLEIRKIREVVDADAADGFDPTLCLPRSRFEPQEMFDELLDIARQRIKGGPLLKLVESLLLNNHEALLKHPAARRNHHAYVGGLLEHSLSVARTCVFLAEKYADYYPEMKPPLDTELVVAGGILHDIGKLREMEQRPEGTGHTPEGSLIGHILIGRDMVREAAAALAGTPLEPERLLRLEHLMITHQGRPEWGSPKPPMTPEAMLVHAADDLDAKYAMMVGVLREDTSPGPVTSKKNILMQHVFRGE
ncbi:MAG: HD domain-containing protein [Planctomycetaceae bacterium]|nr:HD domain-containing protein [Planctomycetaceae bacterium]